MRNLSRQLLLSTFLLSCSASAALSADPTVAPPTGGYDWSGFYVGVGIGAGAVVHELSSPAFLPGASFNGIGGEGIFGELTIGYDHMLTDRFLIGAFVDGRLGTIGTSLDVPGAGLSADVDLPYGFDVAVRVGYLVTPRTLAYALGGYTWQHFDASTNIPGVAIDWDRGGYVVGLGLETVVSGNWTLKGEYRYAAYATQGFGPAGAPSFIDIDSSTHTFHVGANYRFGATAGGGAAFEEPVYNWTGFYVGAGLGAGAVVHDLSVPPLGGLGFNGIGGEGIFAEAMVGYDHEFANGFVAGVMLDGRYSGIATTIDTGPILGPGSVNVDMDYGFDILARAGYKFTGATLGYLLAGYSWQHFDINATGAGTLIDWDASGLTVGAGLDAAVSDRVTLGLEYRYSHFEGEDFGTGGLINIDPSAHTVRATMKFKLY